MAVIELEPSVPWDPADTGPVARRFGPVVALLAVIALLLNGPWQLPGGGLHAVWRAETVGGFFWLTQDAAYTIGRAGDAAVPRLVLTARDPADGTARWSADLTGPLAVTYTRAWETLVSRFPPTLDLNTNTAVIDTRTGDSVRGYPVAAMPLVYLAADVAVTIDRDPAAGPEGPLPPLSQTGNGLDRPHLVVARDLATGAVRWTLSLALGTVWSLPGVHPAAEGIVAAPDGEEWMVTRGPDVRARVWNLRTGGLVNSRLVPDGGPQSYVAALESTLLARAESAGRAVLTGFDPLTLEQRWRARPPDIYGSPFECGSLLCLQADRAVWAIDHTGAVAWRIDSTRLRPQVGPTARLVAGYGQPLALFDPDTGGSLPADARWRVLDIRTSGGTVVLGRPDGASGEEIGVLDLGTGSITVWGGVGPLGRAAQCLTAGGRLACEDGGVVQVWQ